MLFKRVETKIGVEGMHCGGCANRVKNALSALKGVKSVDVSLENKMATVISKQALNESEIKQAIEDLGFSVSSIA